MTKTKILYLSSSPSNLDKLKVDEEFRAIYENINGNFFEIQSVSKTKISDIQAVIYESQPDIIHFSGHGSSEDIFLETDQSRSAGVLKSSFIRTFQNLKKKPEIIFLNACRTYDNLDDLSYIIDFVIATDCKVSDSTAIKFAGNFYKFLSLGASIKSSFNLAGNQFDIESLINGAKMYRLLVREGVNNDRIFTGNSRHGNFETQPESSRQKMQEKSKPESESKRGNFVTNNGSSIGNQEIYQTGDGTTINQNKNK
jgi:hypothetical protein